MKPIIKEVFESPEYNTAEHHTATVLLIRGGAVNVWYTPGTREVISGEIADGSRFAPAAAVWDKLVAEFLTWAYPLPRLDPRHGNLYFKEVATKVIKANGWDKPEKGFTVEPARYAEGKLAVRPRRDNTGWKTIEALLVPQGRQRQWSNRERAYILSPAQVEAYAAEIVKLRRQQAAAPFAEPKHPGDHVAKIELQRGEGDRLEYGFVTIQDYGKGNTSHSYRVGSFLPGVDIMLPGDSPKVEPERTTWVENEADARTAFDAHMRSARENGWIEYQEPRR